MAFSASGHDPWFGAAALPLAAAGLTAATEDAPSGCRVRPSPTVLSLIGVLVLVTGLLCLLAVADPRL